MNENSGVNTVLLVVIVALLVGGFVWYFKGEKASAPQTDEPTGGLNVDVTLPSGEGEDGGSAE